MHLNSLLTRAACPSRSERGAIESVEPSAKTKEQQESDPVAQQDREGLPRAATTLHQQCQAPSRVHVVSLKAGQAADSRS